MYFVASFSPALNLFLEMGKTERRQHHTTNADEILTPGARH